MFGNKKSIRIFDLSKGTNIHSKLKKHDIMKKETVKNKVIAKLIKSGNNETDVQKMVEKHFEYAFDKYRTVSQMANCIRTIY